MPRIAYVDGRYVRHAEAAVHIEDRANQFADGVYEVCSVVDGQLLDEGPHLDRLDRSLNELRIRWPVGRKALSFIMREVRDRNHVRDGMVYVQVSRGAAPRDHAFPPETVRPTLIVTAKSVPAAKGAALARQGVKVITQPDIRWGRCDIKTVSLLPNVLAKQAAREADAYEAWLVRDGMVIEGSSSNAWIVDQDGNLVTRQLDSHILSGITRRAIKAIAAEQKVSVIEREFSPEEAERAREAFITSASSYVMPVTQINDSVIGNGMPGAIATRLRALYLQQETSQD